MPTIQFQILYVFLVLAHDRRRILHFGVTAHPTAEWTAQQLRDAFPWDSAPRYLLRDRDKIFGREFVDQVKAMGSNRYYRRPVVHGNGRTSSERSVRSGGNVWTTSSCLGKSLCGER